MPARHARVLRIAGGAAAMLAGHALAALAPSDCRPRDADSTCATAVAAGPAAAPPVSDPATILYDGPLAGVPAAGYAYWGFDFLADETGTASPVRPDEFINRSGVPVTVSLTFAIPTNHPCGNGCLPRVEFEVDAGWSKLGPPLRIDGGQASFTATLAPGHGFGWVIGLWQSGNPRLTVTVPKGTTATLREVGLPASPAIATPVAAIVGTCTCDGGIVAACSDGSRFSNGLLGVWTLELGRYSRAGEFNDCLVK